jgi:hypothetical protein
MLMMYRSLNYKDETTDVEPIDITIDEPVGIANEEPTDTISLNICPK